MLHVVYQVYVGETKSVSEALKHFDDYENQLVDLIIVRILNYIALDAKNGELEDKYWCEMDDVSVGVIARREGDKLCITLRHVSVDGSPDPEGDEGLDQLGYSKTDRTAELIAIAIGERISFTQTRGPRFLPMNPELNGDLEYCTRHNPQKIRDEFLFELSDGAEHGSPLDPDLGFGTFIVASNGNKFVSTIKPCWSGFRTGDSPFNSPESFLRSNLLPNETAKSLQQILEREEWLSIANVESSADCWRGLFQSEYPLALPALGYPTACHPVAYGRRIFTGGDNSALLQ